MSPTALLPPTELVGGSSAVGRRSAFRRGFSKGLVEVAGDEGRCAGDDQQQAAVADRGLLDMVLCRAVENVRSWLHRSSPRSRGAGSLCEVTSTGVPRVTTS